MKARHKTDSYVRTDDKLAASCQTRIQSQEAAGEQRLRVVPKCVQQRFKVNCQVGVMTLAFPQHLCFSCPHLHRQTGVLEKSPPPNVFFQNLIFSGLKVLLWCLWHHGVLIHGYVKGATYWPTPCHVFSGWTGRHAEGLCQRLC